MNEQRDCFVNETVSLFKGVTESALIFSILGITGMPLMTG